MLLEPLLHVLLEMPGARPTTTDATTGSTVTVDTTGSATCTTGATTTDGTIGGTVTVGAIGTTGATTTGATGGTIAVCLFVVS